MTAPRCGSPATRCRCINALEVLQGNQYEIKAVTPATAPLWLEVPGSSTLPDRIAALREIAGADPALNSEAANSERAAEPGQ